MKYLIIGNGSAGTSCAQRIRQNDKTGKITILSDEKVFAYGRPLISYYLAGKVCADKMRYRPEEFYKNNEIGVVLNCKAQEIDVNKKTVKCCGGKSYEYDKLLIATGSVAFVPQTKGTENFKNVFTFLNFESAQKIKRAVETLNKKAEIVIVGAGLIGLKAAEALYEKADKIHVIDLSDGVMSSVLDNDCAKIVQKHIERFNVKFYLKKSISEIKKDCVVLSDGTTIGCDIIITAVGVRADIELAKKAGIKTDRGIIVDNRMQTSVKDVYAAGDCTETFDVLTQQNKVLALWPNAYAQGETAGANMSGQTKTFDGSFAVNAINLFGMQLISAGIVNSKSENFKNFVEYGKNEEELKKLVVKDDKLVGFVLINRFERAGIYTSLIKSKTDLKQLNYDIARTEIGLNSFKENIRYDKLFRGVK